MTSSPRARATGFTAAIAVVAALLSPLVALSTATAADIVGDTGGVAPNSWQDRTISDVFVVGVPYQDSVQAPAGYANYTTFSAYNLPAGLQAYIVPSTGVISITGTPTTAGANQSISIYFEGANISVFYLEFDNLTVTAPLTPTTTTVSADPVQNFSTFSATAQVSPSAATGTVTFKLGNIVVGSAPVVAGEATYSGPASSGNIGTNSVLTAIYSGDATYATSTSTSTATVATYGIRVLTGTVTSNGERVVGDTVVLQDPTGAGTGFSDTTDASGTFEILLGIPTTQGQVTAQYRLYASGVGVYYRNGGGNGLPNATTLADSSPLINSNWNAPLDVFYNVSPSWTDETLAQPRVGDSYSDTVTATSTGTPSTVTYSLTGDPLPSWLTFTNGSFTSATPTDQTAHTFTVVATSSYGSISKQFTLQAAAAGVAPTFTDTTIAEPQQGTPLSDGIAAAGDPTITYSSTTLPAGLTLNPTTGALTGIPATAAGYSVTFTATNEFGSDTFDWDPTVIEPSSVTLELDNWVAGTPLEDTGFEAGSVSLQVGSTYTVYLHSAPVLLDTGVVGASGSFARSLTLPPTTEVGAHELILTGVARNGTTLTAHVWFTLLPNGTIGAISYTGPIAYAAAVTAALASTGSAPLLPLGLAGALLLAGFVLVMRRQSQQA
jgi:hypothetical protein